MKVMPDQAATATMRTTAEDVLLRQDDGGIARLVLNRPAQRNALDQALLERLAGAIAAVSADDSVRAVIIAANGPGFCGGHDLREMTDHRNDPDGGRDYYEALFASCSAIMQAIIGSPKVFVAEVHGIATAAGCQLVATCDLAVASSQARFGGNGVDSGLFCTTPMVALSRNLGRKKAMELLTLGRLISAEEALQSGLINQVVAPEALQQTARDIAAILAQKSRAVLALGKQAFYQQLAMPLEDAYRHTSKIIVDNMMMADAQEGICAFLEKRKARWRDA
jgi:enoyl-CoA hydratase/carnithine racemase